MNTSQPRLDLKYFVLETTRRCNLRCIHCAVSEENNLGSYDASDLSIELFRKLLPLMRKFKPTVTLSGHGETFLHPNFMEMLEEVVAADCKVNFQTNGTILTPRNVEKFVRAGVDYIVVSLDGASPEVFDKIRRRASLDKILDNIRLLNQTKRRLHKEQPRLGIEFVAMRQNIHELPGVIKLADELEATDVIVAELAEYNMTRGQSLANDPLMAEWAPKAETEARKRGVHLVLPPNIPGRAASKPVADAAPTDPSNPATYKGLRKTCKEPWEKVFVQYNGEVRPCCVITESYGNLSSDSFEKIWYGPRYQALRKSLLSDEPFAVCVRCPFYGWEPRGAPEAFSAATADGVEGAVAGKAGSPHAANSEGLTARPTTRSPSFGGIPQGGWRRLLRRLAGTEEEDVRLPNQQLIWLLNRLNSPNPQTDLEQIVGGDRTLGEVCLALLECGESLSNRAFVGRAYQKILGREPDEPGSRGYIHALETRQLSRGRMIGLVLSSMEFKRILASPSCGSPLGLNAYSQIVGVE